MSAKYKRISENDVLKTLISVDLDIMSPIWCITLVNIATLLKTSRYQVKKHMDNLVRKGIAVLERTCIYGEDYTMPYNGYAITKTVKVKSGEDIDNSLDVSEILRVRAMYQRAKAEHEKLFNECFK